MTAGERVLDRERLVRVELIDAALAQHVAQARIEIVAKRCVARLERRQAADGGDPAVRSYRPGRGLRRSVDQGRP